MAREWRASQCTPAKGQIIKPLSLHLENARTYQRLDWDIPQGQAIAICSPNGGGKSTLCNAIDVALFGAEGRSLADWLSRDRPEQTMVIALTFEHGGETYRIRRSFSGKGRGASRVDFEIEGPGWHVEPDEHGDPMQVQSPPEWEPLTFSAAATQEEIERIIGLSRETFRASAFMAQGDSGAFCEAQPRERKQILASVLGLGVWDSYRDRARAELRDAEQSLVVVRAKIEAAEHELAGRLALDDALATARDQEQVARTALEESGSQLAKARERLSALREAAGLREAAERARDAAERAHASLLERIAALEGQIREAETRLAEREGLEVLAEGLPRLEREQENLAEWAQGFVERQRLAEERNGLNARQARIYEQVQGLRRKVAQAQDVTTTSDCDRCGRPLQDEFAARAAESYQLEIDTLTAGKDGLEETGSAIRLNERLMTALPDAAPDAERVRQVADLIRLGQDANAKLAALAEVEASKTLAAADLSKVRAELPEREASIESARARMGALGPHDPDEEPLLVRGVHVLEVQEQDQKRTLDATLQKIARLDERLERLDRLDVETQTAKNEEASLQNEVELLSHLERACGQNGVPALILETSAIPQMEAEWNRVLKLLPTESGDIFEVELHTQRKRKTGEGAVDALDIVVYANGNARPYASYSGGERARIDIAQRRALSALLTHRKGAECPLMILDEPNSLDDQGMAALAQVLEDLAAAEGLMILVVSHDPALRDAFENSITIEKVDGRSRIVGATEPAPIMEVA